MLGLLILIFVFLSALVGKQLFGSYNPGAFCTEGELIIQDSRRLNFDTLLASVFTVIICITGSWVEVMRETAHKHGDFSIWYFIVIIVIGHFMLLNLFLAILLKNVE
jgi:hypothetical protein